MLSTVYGGYESFYFYFRSWRYAERSSFSEVGVGLSDPKSHIQRIFDWFYCFWLTWYDNVLATHDPTDLLTTLLTYCYRLSSKFCAKQDYTAWPYWIKLDCTCYWVAPLKRSKSQVFEWAVNSCRIALDCYLVRKKERKKWSSNGMAFVSPCNILLS